MWRPELTFEQPLPVMLHRVRGLCTGDGTAALAGQAWHVRTGCRRVQDAVGNGMFGLLLCLALVYPSSCLVRGMVEEKETRMRETMCAPPTPPFAQRSMLHHFWKSAGMEGTRVECQTPDVFAHVCAAC